MDGLSTPLKRRGGQEKGEKQSGACLVLRRSLGVESVLVGSEEPAAASGSFV